MIEFIITAGSLLIQGAWLMILIIVLSALVTSPIWGTALILALLLY